MAGGADQALHQHAGVAERTLRLGPCALERDGQLRRALHSPHAAPAAAGRRLDHEREAELLPDADGILHALHRAAAPGRHRHAGLLGQPLALDLVAERAHDARVRADEDDAEALAQLCEGGVLGHESPADPRRVGPGLDQRPLERCVVEVGAAAAALGVGDGGGAEAVALVGLAHEQRVALGVRVERDDPDRVGALLVHLAHGVDGPHGGFAAVDDGEAVEWTVHG
jgi:hypothetical protein